MRIGAAGKIVTAFDMARAMALGADWCNSARGFMFALGCIQSQACHTDHCPTGVATQDPSRGRALVVSDKAERVRNFHRATLARARPSWPPPPASTIRSEFRPEHFCRRMSMREIASFADLYPAPAPGAFLAGEIDPRLSAAWRRARPDSFRPALNG